MRIPPTLVPLPHLLLQVRKLFVTNTTHALREAHAAVCISMVITVLDGDAAPWSLQPAVMTITAAALMSILSVMLVLELAVW